MENDFIEENEKAPSRKSSMHKVDSGQPPQFTWRRRLNCTVKVPSGFTLKFQEFRHMAPIGMRLYRHAKQGAAKGRASIFDVFRKHIITSDHGIPLGGIGKHWKKFPTSSDDGPVLANQFSVFVSRPHGKQFSTVLSPRNPKLPNYAEKVELLALDLGIGI
ncbi:hypothetical protein Ddye_005026 [Dipteronia dyeriana]|uniref:Uncharacterized protein n=1 Tax=Dipteronia dyeriana TaxID=168575 RepID=A0AAD9XGB2_9ROSI|nr:hypothetical protein Ddye_005026 [Dipteronia dyeriana]